jgi:hypothetical protein
VAEVITDGSIESLEQYLDIDELPDPEAEPAPNDNPEPAESRWKTDRKEWEWEEEARSFTSKGKVQRRFCSMEGCKAKVVTYCGKCDRTVCIDHFEEYHTKS